MNQRAVKNENVDCPSLSKSYMPVPQLAYCAFAWKTPFSAPRSSKLIFPVLCNSRCSARRVTHRSSHPLPSRSANTAPLTRSIRHSDRRPYSFRCRPLQRFHHACCERGNSQCDHWRHKCHPPIIIEVRGVTPSFGPHMRRMPDFSVTSVNVPSQLFVVELLCRLRNPVVPDNWSAHRSDRLDRT